ncbi:MAG: hypothetical protein P4N60_19335 [Verrucomicrobiae bacterium]|nr:hypothetical protein [Verrucomicrobiae bacterium]
MKVADHLPLHDYASGIRNLDNRDGGQRQRDYAQWFEGFGDGIFWGLILGFIITLIFL